MKSLSAISLFLTVALIGIAAYLFFYEPVPTSTPFQNNHVMYGLVALGIALAIALLNYSSDKKL